jgi:hypothetical protein
VYPTTQCYQTKIKFTTLIPNRATCVPQATASGTAAGKLLATVPVSRLFDRKLANWVASHHFVTQLSVMD